MSQVESRGDRTAGATLEEIELGPETGAAAQQAAEVAAAEAPSAVSVLALVPVCGTALVERIDGDELSLRIGGEAVRARRDPSVHPIVLQGAHERGERVLAEHRVDDGWVVVGALRTR